MATHDEEGQQQQVAGALDDLGVALRRRPSVRDDVMRRVTQHAATNPLPAAITPAARWAGRPLLGKLIAVAACGLVALLIWSPWSRGIGASEAFAAAIANVGRGQTFACRQISTAIGPDGKREVRETVYIFKEPNLERIERLGDMSDVIVTDYAKQVRLVMQPADKTASLQDISTMYATDPKTGQLKATELGTHARDDVGRISAKAVRDLGTDKLNGHDVRVLQSADGTEPVATVCVDPDDGKPVQVELASPSRGWTFAYTDIRIDTDLPDDLFNLEPPPGYAMERGQDEPVKQLDEMNGKMMAKTMRIMLECMKYTGANDGKWPARLDDLRAAGLLDAQALATLLAAPDSKDGKPVFVYRRPKDGETDVVVLYEAPEVRRPGQVICGFTDCHAEVVSDERFKELMKQHADHK